MNTEKYTPESLGWWDRIFNRYNKVLVKRGEEVWEKANFYRGELIKSSIRKYARFYAEYHIVDRTTGYFTLKKEYLDEQ